MSVRTSAKGAVGKVSSGYRRDLERTRRRILDAAAREFADCGLSGARVETIARKAGVSKAMIYYIFGGKEDLHLAVLETLFQEKTSNQDPVLVREDLAPKDFVEMLKISLRASLRKKEYVRIMLHDVATGGKALRRLRRKRPDLFEIFDRISGMLMDSMAGKRVRRTDPDKSVMMLILLMAALASMLPHMDLARPRGSDAQKALSDPDGWEAFLSEAVMRILGV
jgi:AcrR family transcriptional regulator